jgi:hypothetical protein
MPELERLLQEHLEKNTDVYKQKAADAAERAVKVRDELSRASRRSRVRVPATARITASAGRNAPTPTGTWSNTPPARGESTGSGGRWRARTVARGIPVWHEYPERLRRANAVFMGERP